MKNQSKPSKLALFNSVKSNYRLTQYQPIFETAAGRIADKMEKDKAKAELIRLSAKTSDKGLSLTVSPEISELFPKPKVKGSSKKTPAQIAREKRKEESIFKLRGH